MAEAGVILVVPPFGGSKQMLSWKRLLGWCLSPRRLIHLDGRNKVDYRQLLWHSTLEPMKCNILKKLTKIQISSGGHGCGHSRINVATCRDEGKIYIQLATASHLHRSSFLPFSFSYRIFEQNESLSFASQYDFFERCWYFQYLKVTLSLPGLGWTY